LADFFGQLAGRMKLWRDNTAINAPGVRFEKLAPLGCLGRVRQGDLAPFAQILRVRKVEK
jgi:hypothetical protein